MNSLTPSRPFLFSLKLYLLLFRTSGCSRSAFQLWLLCVLAPSTGCCRHQRGKWADVRGNKAFFIHVQSKINKSKTKTIYIYSHLSTFLLNCSKQGREPGSVRGGGGDRMGGAEGVSLRSFRVCVRRWWGSALNCWMVVPLLTGVAAIPSTVEELRPQEAGV